MNIECPISLGEFLDKLSILNIKAQKIINPELLYEINKEQALLQLKLDQLNLPDVDSFLSQLQEVNTRLWNIEDAIRKKEGNQQFDQDFIELARSVYINNDRRFTIKKQINEIYGSTIREVKSYQKY